LTMNDYLEVNVRENKVIAIKAFNNDKMIEPFKIPSARHRKLHDEN
jgi:predicted RNA-binding protein